MVYGPSDCPGERDIGTDYSCAHGLSRRVAPFAGSVGVWQWLQSLFVYFLSWWGALLLSFLDSTLLFVIPFGNDALIIYLAARNRELF